jgi:hypothetical protein
MELRYFRNHYKCNLCPNEWTEEMPVVASDDCPCCENPYDPYLSEECFIDSSNPLPEIYNLVEKLLPPDLNTTANCFDLTHEIQQTIQDWIEWRSAQ